ncbi:MAG: hypothetical protein PHN66_00170 [Candidatus Shapirobacteria bacterium]|nr:hypothetical protein [Candidatus Shapirobacteria bacterium]
MSTPLQILIDNGAIYLSPVSADGEILGPLVAYAGTYDNNGNKERYVGDFYANIAAVEENFSARSYFADLLANKLLTNRLTPSVLIGAPMGGIIFSVTISNILGSRVAFFEKKSSELVINRHILQENDKVVLGEDVCNNFSTTDKMIKIVGDIGAEVIAITCIFNRSPFSNYKGIPVISAIHQEKPEYRQDDPKIKKLIDAYNIVWEPKQHWAFLQEEMRRGIKR